MSNSFSKPADYVAREQALDPSQSFAVTAPAGSGKTSLLTQRVLKLLSLCQHPEQVLAITFTRKAAQEMQHRILSTLQAALKIEHSNTDKQLNEYEQLLHQLALDVLKQDEKHQWNLLLSPHRLRVQTIDSFCQSLVQQLPLSAGNNTLLNSTEVPQSLYEEAVQELLTELDRDDGLREDLSRLLLHLDTNVAKLQQLLVQLLQSRGQWMKPLLQTRRHTIDSELAKQYLENSLQTVINETLLKLLEVLEPHWHALLDIVSFAATNLYRENDSSADASATTPLQVLAAIGENILNHHQSIDDLENVFYPTHDNLSNIQALAHLLTTKENTWRKIKGLNKNLGFPVFKSKQEKEHCNQQKQALTDIIEQLSLHTEVLDLIEDVKSLPSAEIPPNQWQLLDSLTRVLPKLAAYFDVVCARRGQCDFNSVTDAALRALGDDDAPSDLALKLDYRIQHILVDEFQDTSSVQLELLKKLTAGWQQGDGRTLFIVGDAMQSCYGFRDANVGIFMDARIHGVGSVELTPLELSVNFRSQAAIVEWVNHCFQQAFPVNSNISRGAVPYAKAVAFDKSNIKNSAASIHAASPSVEIYGLDNEDSAINTEMEAEKIVAIVQRQLAASADKTVAILARNRSHLHTILGALRNANIRWQAKDVDPLAQRMAVLDLLSLTKALLDIGDRIAWLSVLRAPWCGLSLKDLHQIANCRVAHSQVVHAQVIDTQETSDSDLQTQTKRAPFPLLWQQLLLWPQLNLSNDAQSILNRVVPIFNAALAQQRRKSIRQWIQGVWLALGGPASVGNPEEYYCVEQFFNLLDQHQEGSGLNWSSFNLALDKLYDQSSESSRLQVMTIHKAKGLEFDTVIIPGLARQPRHDDNSLILWQDFLDNDGAQHVLISPLQQTGDNEDLIYQYLKREKNIRTQLESTRLLYIGCTRAISNLVLFTSVKRNTDGELELANKNALIGKIWNVIKDDIRILPSPNSTSNTQTKTPVKLSHILRLSPTWSAPELTIDNTLQRFRPPAYYRDNAAPPNEVLAQRQARQFGILLHQILQQITLSGIQHWNALRVQRQQAIWQAQLLGLGFRGDALSTVLASLVSTVEMCLQDATARWLLDHTHQGSACELELLVADGKSLANGNTLLGGSSQSSYIIDRTFVDQGIRWIVDYKSSQPSAEQSLEAFVQQETELYRPQLSTYAVLMRTLEPELPIKTALYFPRLQHLHVLDDMFQST